MDIPIIDTEKAFGDFAEQYGAEVSDKILTGPNKPSNPDYIFRDEKVIAELKLLKTNPFENKDFKKSLEEKKRNWLRKGHITESELSKVTSLNQLPDICYIDALKLYIRPIKYHVESANKQIKAMKNRLDLEDYKGLLIIGSDGNYAIQPKHAPEMISKLFNSGLYSSINTVVYLTVNMVTYIPSDPNPTRLWVNLYRDKNTFDKVSDRFLDDLYDKWFGFYQRLTGLNIKSIKEMNEEGITQEYILKDATFLRRE